MQNIIPFFISFELGGSRIKNTLIPTSMLTESTIFRRIYNVSKEYKKTFLKLLGRSFRFLFKNTSRIWNIRYTYCFEVYIFSMLRARMDCNISHKKYKIIKYCIHLCKNINNIFLSNQFNIYNIFFFFFFFGKL